VRAAIDSEALSKIKDMFQCGSGHENEPNQMSFFCQFLAIPILKKFCQVGQTKWPI
jgi:hypothetical protein